MTWFESVGGSHRFFRRCDQRFPVGLVGAGQTDFVDETHMTRIRMGWAMTLRMGFHPFHAKRHALAQHDKGVGDG